MDFLCVLTSIFRATVYIEENFCDIVIKVTFCSIIMNDSGIYL